MTKERILQLLESTQKNCAAGRPTVGSDPAELLWLLELALAIQTNHSPAYIENLREHGREITAAAATVTLGDG